MSKQNRTLKQIEAELKELNDIRRELEKKEHERVLIETNNWFAGKIGSYFVDSQNNDVAYYYKIMGLKNNAEVRVLKCCVYKNNYLDRILLVEYQDIYTGHGIQLKKWKEITFDEFSKAICKRHDSEIISLCQKIFSTQEKVNNA